MHARYAPSAYHRLNGMRGIVRRVGMYELARSVAADRIVLSDEGTVLSAYLFALTDVELDRSHVARFTELVPRRTIVYVRAPIEALVERALATGPRPARREVRREVERTIARTVGVFDLVAESSPLRDRVLVVENDDDRAARRRHRVRASGFGRGERVPRHRAARMSPIDSTSATSAPRRKYSHASRGCERFACRRPQSGQYSRILALPAS